VLAVGKQPLRQGPAGAVAALDRPHRIRVGRHMLAHRHVPGLVGAEPPGRQHPLVPSTTSMVGDSLWGSTPMNTSAMSCNLPAVAGLLTPGGHC
jgi:hypothetical protein